MINTLTYSQNCANTLTASGSVQSTACVYTVGYDDFRNFVFYDVILVVVGVYLFFKMTRFLLDLIFRS